MPSFSFVWLSDFTADNPRADSVICNLASAVWKPPIVWLTLAEPVASLTTFFFGGFFFSHLQSGHT